MSLAWHTDMTVAQPGLPLAAGLLHGMAWTLLTHTATSDRIDVLNSTNFRSIAAKAVRRRMTGEVIGRHMHEAPGAARARASSNSRVGCAGCRMHARNIHAAKQTGIAAGKRSWRGGAGAAPTSLHRL